jgi:DNA-directed RNA polymerase specialized sigma24 family protein
MAYANTEIRTPLYTSGDLLDEVILHAYQNYEKRPQELSLEQWLYRIANNVLKHYVGQKKTEEAEYKSLERLQAKELRTLEELPEVTADVEGRPWLAEDLDDSEWDVREFMPPAYNLPMAPG